MAKIVDVKVNGLDELQRNMEELPLNVAKRGVRASLRAGAKVIQDGFVENAPRDTGFLAEHFGIRISVKGQDIQGQAFIGPEGKIDYPEKSGGYREKINSKSGKKFQFGRISVASVARFLEFGTSKLPKNPFMTQTFETRKDNALAAIVEKLKGFLVSEANKLRK